jgi:hypothetical protein
VGNHVHVDGLRQVTFHFGHDIEVQYLPTSPASGDFVSHHGDLWLVSFVTADSFGTTAICRLRRGQGHGVRDVA